MAAARALFHPNGRFAASGSAATLLGVKNGALVAAIVGLLLGILLLGSTVRNEGCLPWQERVGYGDGTFGEGQDVSRCAGSRLPFGSAVLSVAR